MIYAQAGDVGFTQGPGLFQKAIRYATTGPREERTWANHTLLFTRAGVIGHGAGPATPTAWAVEALAKVEEGPWFNRHQDEHGYKLRVFRPTFLTAEARPRLIETARSHVGERYGWWKLLFHAVDRIAFRDRKVLSSFLRVDSRPICSYLVARAFEIAGYPRAFGYIVPAAQDPDEMMDWCDSTTWHADDEPGENVWKFVGEVVIN